MRLRHVKDAFEICASNKDICIENPTDYKGKWREFLENADSLSLEVGCGKGQFLVSLSKENEHSLFLGLELMTSVICRAVQKVKEENIKNVLLINKDAVLLNELFDENEVDKIYINFPDPWPKARHDKRRLTYSKYLEMYKRILKKDGVIRFKTDNFDLYEFSKESFSNFLKDDFKCGIVEYMGDEILTEFETKFKALGNPIYFIEGTFK